MRSCSHLTASEMAADHRKSPHWAGCFLTLPFGLIPLRVTTLRQQVGGTAVLSRCGFIVRRRGLAVNAGRLAGRLDGAGLPDLLGDRAQLGVGLLVGYFGAGLEILLDLVASDARSAAARHPDLAPASIPGPVEPVATGSAL